MILAGRDQLRSLSVLCSQVRIPSACYKRLQGWHTRPAQFCGLQRLGTSVPTKLRRSAPEAGVCHAGEVEPAASSASHTETESQSMSSVDRRSLLRLLAILLATSNLQPLAAQAAGAMQSQRSFSIGNDRFLVNGEPVRLLAGE